MNEMFSIEGRVAVITGASGVLGGSIARSFATQGAKIVALGRNTDKIDELVAELTAEGAQALGITGDVLDVEQMREAAARVVEHFGTIDILVNVAGGNMADANIPDDKTVFDMSIEAWERVTNLNLNGTVYPTLAFGKIMAEKGKGSVVNITSMATYSAITRVLGYSAAKTGIISVTQWMAMELATKFGDGVRVNAVAPGFFIGNQNRAVLINPDGSLTERSKKVLAKTPMRRFGEIDELNGAVQFLCSDAASFITGVVLPVDGGFSSFSGV
ncbi:MAG: SDR family oxidoreductase [Tidjanibacter sp.]|nr:SDR family oxidoreductase [Tidjanibacter sp.]MBR6831418.1 SDR family oxidoreductase [Tidjanibacter sp.]